SVLRCEVVIGGGHQERLLAPAKPGAVGGIDQFAKVRPELRALSYTAEDFIPYHVPENSGMLDGAFHQLVVIPDVTVQALSPGLDHAALRIREHHHVDGFRSAVVTVIEKILPVTVTSRSASVAIRVTGIKFDNVDPRLAHLVDVGFPDVGVSGNKVVAVG